MNLLIVDDNAQMRRMIGRIVGDAADEILECGDGREALAAYTRHRPDWVLMDLKMREMNGIGATREITQAFPEARIIIVTDYDNADLREAARAAGACGYVVKENLFDLRRRLTAPDPPR